jgi:hypothetical protein
MQGEECASGIKMRERLTLADDNKVVATRMRNASPLFRLLLWIGLLTLLIPESQAFVSNLPMGLASLSSTARGQRHRSDREFNFGAERIRNEGNEPAPRNVLPHDFGSSSSPSRRFGGKWLERPNKTFKRKWSPWGLIAFAGLVWSSSAGVSHASSMAAGSTLTTPTAVSNCPFIGVAVLCLVQAFGSSTVNLVFASLQQAALWYTMYLTANPVITKSVTAGVIGIIGDYMAQWLEYMMERRNNPEQEASSLVRGLSIHGRYSFRRGLSILTDGIFISGPLMHFGYNLFESIMPINVGGASSSLAAMAHVVADSVILDSIFVASTFIVTGIMEGYTYKQLVPQLRSDYVPTLKASWATSFFLLPFEFACFRYLPLTFRVMSVNFLDVVWDAVVSFMAHRSRKHDLIDDVEQADDSTFEPVAHDVSDTAVVAF